METIQKSDALIENKTLKYFTEVLTLVSLEFQRGVTLLPAGHVVVLSVSFVLFVS